MGWRVMPIADRIIISIPIADNKKKMLSWVNPKMTPTAVKPIPKGSKTCFILLFIGNIGDLLSDLPNSIVSLCCALCKGLLLFLYETLS